MKLGVAEVKLWALEDWHGSTLCDQRERVALEYAEAMTLSDVRAGDELMVRLKRHFDDAIVELSALIAFQKMSSKFNATLAVPPQGFCRVLRAQPADEGAQIGGKAP